MSYFALNYINLKFNNIFKYLLSPKFNLKILGFIVILWNFVNILAVSTRQHAQIINIETVGLPAISMARTIIVFGILGIVAECTIPNCVLAYQQNLIIIQLKKDYSVYANAMDSVIANIGTPDGWGENNADGKTTLSDLNMAITNSFRVIKNCNTEPGCFPDINYKNLKGVENETNINRDTNYTKFQLPDGSSAGITLWSPDCKLNWGDTPQLQNVCGMLVTDINGDKKPNIYGKDFFGFALTKYGLVPLGTQKQTKAYPFSGFCSLNSNANFKYENGLSCTAWVLYNQNMDYLKCKGLHWDGKTSCGG